jgi:hypothetical protein
VATSDKRASPKCNAPHWEEIHMGQYDRLLDTILRAAATALIVAGAALLSLAGVRAQTGPLVIAKQGYFFVGGTIDPNREGSPTVGHMYVEYQVPQPLTHPYPVVMIMAAARPAPISRARPMGAKAGRNISCAGAMRSTWSTRWRAAARPSGRRRTARSPPPI